MRRLFEAFHFSFAGGDRVLVFFEFEIEFSALDLQPFGDLFAFFAIFQAAVDLLADGLRQPGDLPCLVIKKEFFLGLLSFINLYQPLLERGWWSADNGEF